MVVSSARGDDALEPLTPERRREMTRRHLLEAAASVFADKGFHGATLDEIASVAGFSKGAVYSNFESKDDLYEALLDDRLRRQVAVTAEALEAGPHGSTDQVSRMRQLLRPGPGSVMWDDTWARLYIEFLIYALRNPVAAAKLSSRADREGAAAQALVEAEHSAMGVKCRYETRDLAEIALALFNGLGLRRLLDPGSVTPQMVDTALDLLYAHMGTDAGAEGD